MGDAYQYSFPAIRGVQAGREYYVSMCPLRLIPKLFAFDEEEVAAELRAQRTLNKARVPEIARYIVDHQDSYVFSALTASVDADFVFESAAVDERNLGILRIPMEGQIIINDGQHRRAAIVQALLQQPELGNETIAVVFFSDIGLRRSQQMFADLNRYAIRPSTSISMLYDHRDDAAELTRRLVNDALPFRDLVETDRSSLSARSRRLFTFSAIYYATKALLADQELETLDDGVSLACAYWEAVAAYLPEWEQVRRGKIASSEVREDQIHSHGVVLHAFGRAGAALLRTYPEDWREHLAPLEGIDWSRKNPDWAGRAVVRGKLSKATQNVTLTANYIKSRLGLELTAEDRRLEDSVGLGDLETSKS
jgi:DNA sulfur modification protein DndB